MNHFGDVPQHLYELWQEVRIVSQLESGWSNDHGIITGLLWSPPEAMVEGWYYQVSYFEIPSAPWLGLPHSELVSEGEIHLVLSQLPDEVAQSLDL